jgi:hypothetical protein
VKAQFKYAFKAGFHIRGYEFIVILIFNLISVVLGLLGLLPLAALITVVSLSGTAVAVMAITNIISDIGIFREMLSSPRAYLQALTPAPRYKTLIANILVISIYDIISMAVAITGVTLISFILAGTFFDVFGLIRGFTETQFLDVAFGLGVALTVFARYLLLLMFIISIVVVRKSIFYQKRAGGFFTVLVAIGAVYVSSISQFLLAPFGILSRFSVFYIISLGRSGIIAYGILILIQVTVLLLVTSRLMERKLNI